MSGIVLVALAGLLVQQAAPPPSTLQAYFEPVVRPFEPEDDFGRDLPQGDGVAARLARPLTAPVTVDAYDGTYELPATQLEIAYQAGVASAEARADQSAGPLDGVWRVQDAAGQTLYEIALLDSGAGPAEGGWRGAGDSGAAVADGQSLTLEGAGVIALERTRTGWRGQMTRAGRTVTVTLSRPD
ncbi:hypothetical protein [Brevundimonas sp.]|uniref:hypothetical protein n=1 Tax=Brevundimonas sp. TaxID=1871086 RepID=UPI002D56C47D|nr:hypothetical protein [Brevundimonas sp.]HYD28378.1 hypothetical protein [Brevundimonas sp.]